MENSVLSFTGHEECKKCYRLVHDQNIRQAFVIDAETTGRKKKDRITQLSALRFTEDMADDKYKRVGTLNIYTKPYLRINPEAALLTGISNKMLSDKPSYMEAFKKIQPFFKGYRNSIVIGYNVGFDVQKLDHLYRFCCGTGFTIQESLLIDVMRMAIELIDRDELTGLNENDLGGGHFNQVSVAKYLGIDTKNSHDALIDIQMTFRVMLELLKRYSSGIRKEQYTELIPLVISKRDRLSGTKETAGYSFVVTPERGETFRLLLLTTATNRFFHKDGILDERYDLEEFAQKASLIINTH